MYPANFCRKLLSNIFCLTSSLRMPDKPAIYFSTADMRTSRHAFRFLRLCAGAASTHHAWPWHCAGWRVYPQMFLGVQEDKVRWPRTKCTTVKEWVHSFDCFVGFLPNPFIHDLFLWCTSQEFVKTDLYPLSLMSLWYAVCSTGCWSTISCCFGACQRSSYSKERRPQ